MIQIAVMGHGTVGSGVAEIFNNRRDALALRASQPVNVKYILDIRDFPDSPYAEKFIKDFEIIVSDPEISVVAEVMGGLHPAYEFVSRCLAAGKSVVTSNKELVAAKGYELLQLARENNVNFMFEASVGGGIPVIRPMSLCLSANKFSEICGILNGTTNFILTKMIKEQLSFADALAIAQDLGYAERNPAADVEGHDTCRKICILSSLAFGKHVYPDQVHTEGITEIDLADVAYAESLGYVIKLLGHSKQLEDGRIYVITAPYLIPVSSQLSGVEDVFNAVMVNGDETGDVLFYGKGAGKFPTASAVVADIIDCIKSMGMTKYAGWDDAEEGFVADSAQIPSPYYLRFVSSASDIRGEISKVFGEVKLLTRDNAPANEIAVIVEPLTSDELESKLASLSENTACASKIRVADFA